MYETGTAAHSLYSPDPPTHVIVRVGDRWVTWCGGGPALHGSVTITRRRCPRCLALARRDLRENDVAPDESSDLDWFLEREPKRTGGTS